MIVRRVKTGHLSGSPYLFSRSLSSKTNMMHNSITDTTHRKGENGGLDNYEL
jgi:hypothetical protein